MLCNSSNSCFCSNEIFKLTEIKSDILTGSVEDFRLFNKSAWIVFYLLLYILQIALLQFLLRALILELETIFLFNTCNISTCKSLLL